MSIQIEKDILSLNMIIDCTNDVELRIVYILYCMCSVHVYIILYCKRIHYIRLNISETIYSAWEEQKNETFV